MRFVLQVPQAWGQRKENAATAARHRLRPSCAVVFHGRA